MPPQASTVNILQEPSEEKLTLTSGSFPEDVPSVQRAPQDQLSAQQYRAMAHEFHRKRVELHQQANHFSAGQDFCLAGQLRNAVAQHTELMNQCNDNAVKLIMIQHRQRIKNNRILDLHYLYTKEAILEVDIFLDFHIMESRINFPRAVKCVWIITGQGKHSVNGVPKIRPAVMKLLEERQLFFDFVNPGMLQVAVSSGCKLASELREVV